MIITKHALKRLKQRFGYCKPQRLAKEAYEKGEYRKYIEGIKHHKGTTFKVYKERVFVFHGKVLKTVIKL